ncbi:hypothetical protein AMR72_16425 [Flavobacterium psychrophilum]|nr:hypothetical protein AMR72_16425 [Flavobacterium psychrophilum]AOE53950.1 hypothetical protein ALW18_16415 [Flavobacterium psychrophilum]
MPVFDKEKARIKMVAFTKNGYNNIRWYSLAKYDKASTFASDEKIINGMMRRLKDFCNMEIVQKVVFYDNKTDQAIREFNG